MYKIPLLSMLMISFLVIGLVSCSDDDDNSKIIDPNDNTTEITVQARTISGKLLHRKLDIGMQGYTMAAWDKGEATLTLTYGDGDIATSPVAADGSYSLTLPAKVLAKRFFSPKLIWSITPSPSALMMTSVPLLFTVEYKENGIDMPGFISMHSFKEVAVDEIDMAYSIYCFDSDGTISGTAPNGSKYDLQATKGWNFMYWDYSAEVPEYKLVPELPANVYIYF